MGLRIPDLEREIVSSSLVPTAFDGLRPVSAKDLSRPRDRPTSRPRPRCDQTLSTRPSIPQTPVDPGDPESHTHLLSDYSPTSSNPPKPVSGSTRPPSLSRTRTRSGRTLTANLSPTGRLLSQHDPWDFPLSPKTDGLPVPTRKTVGSPVGLHRVGTVVPKPTPHGGSTGDPFPKPLFTPPVVTTRNGVEYLHCPFRVTVFTEPVPTVLTLDSDSGDERGPNKVSSLWVQGVKSGPPTVCPVLHTQGPGSVESGSGVHGLPQTPTIPTTVEPRKSKLTTDDRRTLSHIGSPDPFGPLTRSS